MFYKISDGLKTLIDQNFQQKMYQNFLFNRQKTYNYPVDFLPYEFKL